MDHLGLVKTVHRFGESIIERVADTAHRGFDAGLRQALGVSNADYWADSTGRRNTKGLEVAMTVHQRASDRCTRKKLDSPGRPPA